MDDELNLVEAQVIKSLIGPLTPCAPHQRGLGPAQHVGLVAKVPRLVCSFDRVLRCSKISDISKQRPHQR